MFYRPFNALQRGHVLPILNPFPLLIEDNQDQDGFAYEWVQLWYRISIILSVFCTFFLNVQYGLYISIILQQISLKFRANRLQRFHKFRFFYYFSITQCIIFLVPKAPHFFKIQYYQEAMENCRPLTALMCVRMDNQTNDYHSMRRRCSIDLNYAPFASLP